ncbi:uridine/cytidine kinase [Entamoeba marina]
MNRRHSNPVLIAVCGGTASEKLLLNLTEEELANVSEYNFDSPDAFDWPLIYKTLRRIKQKKKVIIPNYDFTTNSRTNETTTLDIGDVVLFEGLYPYYNIDNMNISGLFDLKIFVETDDDVRLGRRIIRDMNSRGRSLESVLYQYNKFVKPAYDSWISPQRKSADIIIPWGEISNNALSVDMEQINRYPVIKMVTRYINQFIEKSNFEKVVRSGSAEILTGVEVKESSMSDIE